MKRFLLVGLIVLAFAGCTQEDGYEFEPEPNILALMHTRGIQWPYYGSYQYIIVAQTHDIGDTLDLWDAPIADQISIWGGSDTFDFYRTSDLLWFNATAYNARADFNDTTLYHLEVVMSWGDTVTAEAMMPSPIYIIMPSDSDTVQMSQASLYTITWNSCKNTELYTIYCIPDVDTSELDDISPLYSLPSFTTDTSYTFFLERMVFPWDFNMHYVLRVIAVSPEYAAYMGFFGPGEVYSNLSAGYGMFGGIAEDAIRVFIVP